MQYTDIRCFIRKVLQLSQLQWIVYIITIQCNGRIKFVPGHSHTFMEINKNKLIIKAIYILVYFPLLNIIKFNHNINCNNCKSIFYDKELNYIIIIIITIFTRLSLLTHLIWNQHLFLSILTFLLPLGLNFKTATGNLVSDILYYQIGRHRLVQRGAH